MTTPFPPKLDPLLASNAMVVTADRLASDVGLQVLQEGGNAVDAAVAVSLALAVVNPEAGNLGGSGYMLLRMGEGTAAALDHRSTAPAAAGRDLFLGEVEGVDERSVLGHLSVAVPGSVRGIWDAHERFGSMPWAALVEPAIVLAHSFIVRPNFLRSFTPPVVEALGRFPETARIFLPGGSPPIVGDAFVQLDLAHTLQRIASDGPDGFYRGETADRIVAEMQRGGGLITHEDLAGYRTEWLEPVRFTYRGYTVLSMPPSSSGGLTLAEGASILQEFPLADLPWQGGAHIHLMAEAWRRAYVDRNHYLADPAFHEIPVETLTSPEYARWRAQGISRSAATRSSDLEPGVEAFLAERERGRARETPPTGCAGPGRSRPEGEHTTHFSIVDAEGNAASVTTTLNTWYGSKVVAAGTGVLLNNEMDDFACRPGLPNYFGLVQGVANQIEPGKRMLSAMSPTIVFDPGGRLFMVLGTPGGSTIITTVFQVISNVIDHGMNVAQAVVAPRVHHQHLPDQIFYEPGALPPSVQQELADLGHTVFEREVSSGDAQAILVLPDGMLSGQADPRRGGAAVGY